MYRKILTSLILIITISTNSYCQEINCVLGNNLQRDEGPEAAIETKNGFYISPNGELRVLVIYAEVNFDVNPSLDRFPTGTTAWPVGQLPTYKDDLFDLNWTGSPQAKMTKYWDECSLGNFRILGDYLNTVFTINESSIGVVNFSNLMTAVRGQINALGVLNTNGGSTISDLDLWINKQEGQPAVLGPDAPFSYDHVMFIFRNNSANGPLSGAVTWVTGAPILTYDQDTYSYFNGGKSHPFPILRHEFNHLLFGSNVFHNSGSHSAGGRTFINDQGGWGMMGGSNSSFMTCNAWDRDRLNWIHPSKSLSLSAIDISSIEIDTDLDATNPAHSGIYILRDFVTTGDALRIKLPFIPAAEKEQYIWVENHRTTVNNGSEFDQFQYSYLSCVEQATPGLYMYVQAGKELKTGALSMSSAGQYGHYNHPLAADGSYDIQFESSQLTNICVNNEQIFPFQKLDQFENPLTGTQDQEIPSIDVNGDDQIFKPDGLRLWIENILGVYNFDLPASGKARHAFTLNGVNEIGVGTNPSANSRITMENFNGPRYSSPAGPPDNRAVILNGVSIKIIDEMANGDIKIEVKFDETDVFNNARWCGGDIQLPPMVGSNGYSLNLKSGNNIILAQNYTASRVDFPITLNSQKYFVDKTSFTCQSGSTFHVEDNSTLAISESSTMTLRSGSKLELEQNATLLILDGELIIEDGAELILHDGAKLIVDVDGVLTINNSSTGKGLIVGDNVVTSEQAEVQVKGTMQFSTTAIWDHQNSGYYNFFSGHSLILPKAVPLTFNGLGKTVKFLEIQTAASIIIDGNIVDFNSGKVQYGLNSVIVMKNQTDFRGINTSFSAQVSNAPGSIGLDIDDPKFVLINQCDFNLFDKAVKISNATPSILLLGNNYFDNNIGIDLDNSNNTAIAGSFISSNVTGINANNCFLITTSNTSISGNEKGVFFNKVNGGYFNNSNIELNTVGIKGIDALVFLRTGTEVKQNTIGVDVVGSYDYMGGNYTSMLTVGDKGCGSIYNNFDKGVHGLDAILNIDAEQHAIDRGDPNTVIPNRFDNNSTYAFDLCYSDLTVAPSQINALGNYWGTASGTIAPNNYRIKTNTDCIAKPNNGTNIPLIMTSFSSCVPTTSCMDCSTSPGSGNPGGGGGSPSQVEQNVRNAFENANAPFQVEDMVLTRLGFNDISFVELVKDTMDSSWTAISIYNEVMDVETESVHRIQVAKAIKAAVVDPNARLAYLPNDIFAGLTSEEMGLDNFTLFPNPVNNVLNVEVNNDGLYSYNIYNMLGEEVGRGDFNLTTQIKTEKLSGIYFIEIINSSGFKTTKKFVVTH